MNSRPEMIVLGTGPVAKALAFILGAPMVPDEWLLRQDWRLPTTFTGPLMACNKVFQVRQAGESESMTLWRRDMFWMLFGKYGGASRAARGLKWLVIHSDQSTVATNAESVGFYYHISLSDGLEKLIASSIQGDRIGHSEWLGAYLAEKEVKIRKQMLRLLTQDLDESQSKTEILKLARQLSPLAWERFCPPPEDHELANLIRGWYGSPESLSVTQWMEKGRILLSQTSLTP